jgi:hypothetical protein
MSGHIFNIQEDGTLIEMNEQLFETEDVFQSLLERYPNLLAGDQIDSGEPRRWLLVRREMGVPGEELGANRWSLDHLFLDQDAIPTLVEVKRSTDTRLRREVVGQLLDYAANAVSFWSIEQMIAEYERQCGADAIDPNERLEKFLGVGGEPEGFWRTVKTNLQAGRIRLLVVADVVPPELRRVVEFLNSQMDPAEVLAVEIKHFVGPGMRTLVPRVIGQTAAAESRKSGGASFTSKQERTEELLRIAAERGVADLYESVVEALRPLFDSASITKSTVTFYGKIPGVKSGAAMVAVVPGESDPKLGLRMRIHVDRVCEFLPVDREAVIAALPEAGRF